MPDFDRMQGYSEPKRDLFKRPYSLQSDWNMAAASFRRAEECQWRIDQILPVAKQSVYTPNMQYSLPLLFDAIYSFYRDFMPLASQEERDHFKTNFDELRPMVRKKTMVCIRNDQAGRGEKNKPAFAVIDKLELIYDEVIMLRQKRGAGIPSKNLSSANSGLRGLLRGRTSGTATT